MKQISGSKRNITIELIVVGLIMAGLVVWAWLAGRPVRSLPGSIVLAVGLVLLSAIDLRSFRLPDWLTLPLLGLGLLNAWLLQAGIETAKPDWWTPRL